MDEIFLGQGDTFTIQTTKNVELRNTLHVTGLEGEGIDLDIKITADFGTIPEKYHEIMLNVMTSKYYSKVSFGHNPFSQCLPPVKRKWWQFWK